MKFPARGSQAGFTLMEVMITAVIIASALLAISGLQTTAANVEYEAYQRARAMVVAEDMLSRINANRNSAASYVTASLLGTGDSQPTTCGGVGVTLDHCEWSQLLKGSSVTTGGVAQPGMRNAVGCITASATPNEYFVTVAWLGQSSSDSTKPSDCGQTELNNEPYRRVLVRTVRIATLTNLVIP